MLKLSIMSVSNILQKLNRRDTKLFPSLPKLSKKSKILFILLFCFLTVLVSRQILATSKIDVDSSSAIQKYKDKQTAISDGNNQESWMNEAMMSNAMSINQAIAGTIPDDVLEGKTTSWIPGGMIGMTNQAIAYLYNPPASGVQYIAENFNNFLGKPVYATTGSVGLHGIMSIWKSFRDAVYILFSVIFVGIGIAIMLRVKISQNAVITIQSAVPQLITSLVLVTFSYAIAGLLIDLSYLFSGIVLAILFSSQNGISQNILGSYDFKSLVNGGFAVTYGLLYKLLPMMLILSVSAITGGITTGIISLASGGAFIVPGLIAGGITFILVFLIVLVITLVQSVKFFIGIAKCYINVILRVIFAPLEIGMGAIPNSKMNFSSWIWQVVANLAVFPISTIFLVVLNLVLQAIDNGDLWNPPMLGLSVLLKAAIGISGFFLLAKLPNMVPEFIFNIKPSPWGKAIGESFSFVGKGTKGLARYGANTAGTAAESHFTGAGTGNFIARNIGRAVASFTKK